MDSMPSQTRREAARAMGRAGGRKGGPARAASMTPEARSAHARYMTLARWLAAGHPIRRGAFDSLPLAYRQRLVDAYGTPAFT